jgi:hypothetical protein
MQLFDAHQRRSSMGIFSKQDQSSAYVPPQNGSNSTLLGGNVLPVADLRGDLNRSPSTTVDLRFTPVQTGAGRMSHGFIVVTDNATGKQWRSEGMPEGQSVRGAMPVGALTASTAELAAGQRADGRQATSFSTDVPAADVARRLAAFSSAFAAKSIPYGLPISPPVDPYGLASPRLPVTNSNYYASAAWDHLTGTTPDLPRDILAPGWGDHRVKIGFPR